MHPRARRRAAYVYSAVGCGSREMHYKSRFLPQEQLSPDGWKRVEK
jgi:arginyl-tRNA--protein-N-Asp/Glu arginylyltransferase